MESPGVLTPNGSLAFLRGLQGSLEAPSFDPPLRNPLILQELCCLRCPHLRTGTSAVELQDATHDVNAPKVSTEGVWRGVMFSPVCANMILLGFSQIPSHTFMGAGGGRGGGRSPSKPLLSP